MTYVLKVYVEDDDCAADESYVHSLPVDTDRRDIITAVSVFYPTANSILMCLEEDEEQ